MSISLHVTSESPRKGSERVEWPAGITVAPVPATGLRIADNAEMQVFPEGVVIREADRVLLIKDGLIYGPAKAPADGQQHD